jgi:hypothetical protein
MSTFMNISLNPEHSISQLKRIVDSEDHSYIQMNANGGNSLLLVCTPELEFQFIEKLIELMPNNKYKIIDINDLVISFVKDHKDDLSDMFDLLRGSVHQIFKAPDGETRPDLFRHLLTAIEQSYNENRIPILVNSGALYGSGIDNIHLMEHKLVMESNIPLIILYPASQEGERLMFLNSRPSSKYRCMIVN